MEQVKFESKDGRTYLLVEGDAADCRGCAFDDDAEACREAPSDCAFTGRKGESYIWTEV